MSDLVKRLRSVPLCSGCGEYPGGDIAQTMDIAAARIEALERQIAAADRLAEAVSRSTNKTASAVSPNTRTALAAYEASKEQSDG